MSYNDLHKDKFITLYNLKYMSLYIIIHFNKILVIVEHILILNELQYFDISVCIESLTRNTVIHSILILGYNIYYI